MVTNDTYEILARMFASFHSVSVMVQIKPTTQVSSFHSALSLVIPTPPTLKLGNAKITRRFNIVSPVSDKYKSNHAIN